MFSAEIQENQTSYDCTHSTFGNQMRYYGSQAHLYGHVADFEAGAGGPFRGMRCWCSKDNWMEFHVSNVATNIDPATVSNIVKVGDSSQRSTSNDFVCDKFALCLKTSFTDSHQFYLFAFHNQVDPETHSIIRKHAVFKVEYDKFSVNPEVEFSLQ